MARAEKNPDAVAHGKRSWRSRNAKIDPGTENSHASVRKNRTETTETPVRKNRTTGQSEKPYYFYISGEGAHNASVAVTLQWTAPVLTEMAYTPALRRLYTELEESTPMLGRGCNLPIYV